MGQRSLSITLSAKQAKKSHFETVMKKFQGKKVAYVAINVYPDQDAYVVPFMRGTYYTFTPLRSNNGRASKTYSECWK